MIRYLNLKTASILSFIFGFLIWISILCSKGIDLSVTLESAKEIPAAAGYFGILTIIFSEWGWRIPVFQKWLVLVPNLNGTWKGTLQTDWKNPETGEVPGPIDAILVIKQNLYHISIVQMTRESKSWSRSAAVNIDSGNQLKILDFVYSNKPRVSVQDRSTAHEGACSIEIIDKPSRRLLGKYWTDRKTKGEMDFEFSENELKQEF